MAINVLQAAKCLAEESGWELSRLELQKMVYLAHMVYLGMFEEPLVEGNFEAWEYGPVHRDLYDSTKKTKYLIPNKDDFYFIKSFDKEKHKKEFIVLEKILNEFPPGSAIELIKITHWKEGAWAKHYDPDKYNTIIPKKDIIEEYKARFN